MDVENVEALEASYRATYNELQSYREMLASQAVDAGSSSGASPETRPHARTAPKTPPSTRDSRSTHGTDAVIERLLSYGEKVRKRAEDLRKRQEQESGTWKPIISDKARKLRREGIVIEKRLLHKYQEVMGRLDKMRKKKEQDEVSENREVPQIDLRSKRMTSNRHSDVAERLLEYADLHKRFVENMRSRKEEAELYEVSGKPDINPVSKQLIRNMPVEEFLFSWEEERQRRLKEAQEYSDNKHSSRVPGVPRICMRSRRIASGCDRDGSIGDRLAYQGLISRMKKEALAKEKEKFDKAEARPQISIHSANLMRNGDPFERLYQQSFALRGKKEMMSQEMENSADSIPFKPQISSKAKLRPSSSLSAAEGLYAQGLELLRRRQRSVERQALELKLLAEKPKISFNSEVLVRMLEKRLHLSHMDRITGLYKPNRAAREFLERQLLEREKQITFRPKINRNSRTLDQQVHGDASGPAHRTELLASKHERVKQKLLYLQSKKEQDQLEECTFRPSISKTARKVPSHYVSIVHRVSEYLERRQAKLDRERQENRIREVEECTFHPRTSQHTGRNAQSHIQPFPAHHTYQDDTIAHISRRSPLISTHSPQAPAVRRTPRVLQAASLPSTKLEWEPKWAPSERGSLDFESPEKPSYAMWKQELNHTRAQENLQYPNRGTDDMAADDLWQ